MLVSVRDLLMRTIKSKRRDCRYCCWSLGCQVVVKVKRTCFWRRCAWWSSPLHFTCIWPLREIRSYVSSETTGIAYETVRDDNRNYRSRSEWGCRSYGCSVETHFHTKQAGGSGVLLGGVPGVPKGKVTIIGGGSRPGTCCPHCPLVLVIEEVTTF